MYRTICWIHSTACAVMAFSGLMGNSPTIAHRSLIGGTMAFMILLNGWMWSRADTKEARAM